MATTTGKVETYVTNCTVEAVNGDGKVFIVTVDTSPAAHIFYSEINRFFPPGFKASGKARYESISYLEGVNVPVAGTIGLTSVNLTIGDGQKLVHVHVTLEQTITTATSFSTHGSWRTA